jgi:tRNA(fMet)-specific endonuclease VapC
MRSGAKRLKYERLVLDTNAAVDFFRLSRQEPPPIQEADELVVPLFVLAELKLGIERSDRKAENAELLARFLRRCSILLPDASTPDYYLQARRSIPSGRALPATAQRLEALNHDLWIAALCVQHKLPLLTNDRDFDGIEGLEVIHW